MNRIIDTREELKKFYMSAIIEGTRLELLDLIDYAQAHNGAVGLDHLCQEITGLRDLECASLHDWLDNLNEHFEENTKRWTWEVNNDMSV